MEKYVIGTKGAKIEALQIDLRLREFGNERVVDKLRLLHVCINLEFPKANDAHEKQ